MDLHGMLCLRIKACVEKKAACPGPVDCSSITVVAKDYKGMLLGYTAILRIG